MGARGVEHGGQQGGEVEEGGRLMQGVEQGDQEGVAGGSHRQGGGDRLLLSRNEHSQEKVIPRNVSEIEV